MEENLRKLSNEDFQNELAESQLKSKSFTESEIKELAKEIHDRADGETSSDELSKWEQCLAIVEQLRQNTVATVNDSTDTMSELEEESSSKGRKRKKRSAQDRTKQKASVSERSNSPRASQSREGSSSKQKQTSHLPQSRSRSRSRSNDKKKRQGSKRRSHESSPESSNSEEENGRSYYHRRRKESRPRFRSNFSFIQAIEAFDGDFSKWKLFKRTVEDLVLLPEDIEYTMKAALVSKLLQGEAKFMWDNSMSMKNDLNKGWKTLAKKYEDHRQIDSHLHSLVARMPRVHSDLDVNALAEMNKLVLQFETIIDGLGTEFESLARVLCGVIANKFWFEESKKIQKNYATLKKLVPRVDKLYREARILSACAPAWQARPVSNQSSQSNNANAPRMAQRVAAVVPNTYCQFCRSKAHWTSECDANVSSEEKQRILKEKGLCGRCCCRGHQLAECRTRIKRCSQCSQDHSSSLHGVRHRDTNGPSLDPGQVNSVDMPQTKQFWMKTYCNGHEMRVLIDTGATISLISRACIPKYARKRIPTIIAKGFAQGMWSTIKEAASVNVSSPQGLIRLDAYLSSDLEGNTLIIGQDQISRFLREDSKVMHTVWGDYNFEEQKWSQPTEPQLVCFAIQAWHECQEEEKVDEQDVAMEVTKLSNGRYMASFPFFSKSRPRPNYEKAVKKALAQQKRLAQEGILEEYGKQIAEMLKQNHAEEIFEENGHFIGHRSVERPEAASTKFRVVLTPLELNDLLWKGEAKGMDVLSHLMRLRRYRFVLLADIQKAFLQIVIRPEDRKYIRFLWPKGESIHKYQMTVLPFGVVSAPAILTKVLEMVIEEMAEPARTALRDAVYMDDVITGHANSKELERIIELAKGAFAASGFQLHKIRTNLSLDPPLEGSGLPCKVLGIHWNPASDELSIPLPRQNCPKTRRELLSFIGRIFDPYGVYDPCKIELRHLHHRALKLDWDEVFESEFQQEVLLQTEDLRTGQPITIPRRLPEAGILRCFSDASAKALGYVIFLDNRFVFGRAKIMTSDRSIVDGELQALFELCKAIPKVLKMIIKPVEVHILSDSQANLSRLVKSPNEHGAVVARRLLSILKTASRIEARFFHIAGTYNPADCFSRTQELKQSQKWMQLKPEKMQQHMSAQIDVKLVCQTQFLEKDDRYRMWLQGKSLGLQLCLVAKVKRWYLRHRKSSGESSLSVMDNLAYIHQRVGDKPPSDCREVQGIWKYQARNVELCRTWIPRNSSLARLVLWDAHRQSQHRGVDMSMAMIPQNIQIQDGNRMMRKIISQCFRCRRTRAHGIVQPLGPLHQRQLQPCQAFEDVSLDCFGPLKLANGRKIWGLVLYCRSSKAVKLSVVEDLTGETLHQVLVTIWNQVGFPKRIHSDQGSNFTAVRNEITSRPTMETVDMKWTLSTPYAPWMNGGAEKMVHSAKLGLQQFTVLAKSHMAAQRRFTFVERVVNSRPILHMDGEAISAFELANHRKVLLDNVLDTTVDPKLLLEKRQRREFELGLLWKSQYLARAARYCPIRGAPVKLNDVFLVPDKLKNRLKWCTARVVDLAYGSDGLCRSVKLLFRSSDLKKNEERECWRPVQGLIPLTSGGAEN